MTISLRNTFLLLTAFTAFSGALLWNGKSDVEQGLISTSEARVGRPLTPMSYAGVARRTTRRAVYGTAAAAAAAGAYAATPGCVQVTNAYGQVVTRC
ncbi:hypothetical protein [Bradyrhizobium lablabi]|uniref:hypothetical protein n=1 Tax=Bradyrhizobium lablabi TaxID=722472 RepID=UPI001BAD173A|nr:hypothetical protein [Bradyrhizobium lablabi]MBR0694468.1 hypothetical protein [Bradyrhizobium lablabi]